MHTLTPIQLAFPSISITLAKKPLVRVSNHHQKHLNYKPTHPFYSSFPPGQPAQILTQTVWPNPAPTNPIEINKTREKKERRSQVNTSMEIRYHFFPLMMAPIRPWGSNADLGAGVYFDPGVFLC